MKQIYLILTLWLMSSATGFSQGEQNMYDQLAEVNKEWLKQSDVNPDDFAFTASYGAYDMIQQHLIFVEKTLRTRNTDHLTATQQENRLASLDDLQEYWKAEAFPINDSYAYRTPIFIDSYNNFCAVGYLLKASGNENISRNIAAEGNLDYVESMEYPELMAWAGENGFTKEELAWIQPGYPTANTFVSMEDGMNGHVNDIILGDDQVVYAAGLFTTAGGNTAINIAGWYSGFAGFDWFALGDGLPAEVYSLIAFENELYAAGEFFTGTEENPGSSVAKWTGVNWEMIGNLNGIVYDLEVYDGALYAGGIGLSEEEDFDTNVMMWANGSWDYTNLNIDNNGTVNTLETIDNKLYVGGSFNVPVGSIRNNIIAYTNGTDSEEPYSILLPNTQMTVHDIHEYDGDIYISGNAFHEVWPDEEDGWISLGLQRFSGDIDSSWETLTTMESFQNTEENPPYLKSMTTYNGNLIIAGSFDITGFGTMTYGNNLCIMEESMDFVAYSGYALFDDPAYVATTINNELYTGGTFATNGGTTTLNGIAIFESVGFSIDEQDAVNIQAYPNPITNEFHMTTEIKDLSQLNIMNSAGQLVYQKDQPLSTEIVNCSSFARGLYMLQLTDRHNHSYYKKLMIQ